MVRPAGPPPAVRLPLYGRVLGLLLAGYLMFDKAFAYLHVPGTPVYVGELTLLVGVAGAVTATGHLRAAVSREPVLVLLTAFMLWGLLRALPGLPGYGIDAVRDSALWYYCSFAALITAALIQEPALLDQLVAGLSRLVPWMLGWLPVGVVLAAMASRGPSVPGTGISVLTHKQGNAAVAALLALWVLWLFPGTRGRRTRVVWSLVAAVVIALSATQNRGGLLGAAAGAALGLVLGRVRLRLIVTGLVAAVVGTIVAAQLPIDLPVTGAQGRQFSVAQLVDNVASVPGGHEAGNLNGTVEGRQVLWSRILDRQRATGHLVDGSGFGPNLAVQVGVYDAGTDALRSPHNSHLDVLARMGLIGLGLWIALWACWYWQMITGYRRAVRQGPTTRRRVALGCLMVSTAILVSSFFDPQLEGAQVAALLWTVFGIGIAVTSRRAWLDLPDGVPPHALAVPPGTGAPGRPRRVPVRSGP